MRSIKLNHDLFEYFLYKLEELLEKILTAKVIIKHKGDKAIFVEMFAIRLYTYWEAFVGEEIIYCFRKDTSKFCNERGLNIGKRLTLDESIAILSGVRYLDFKSTGDIKNFCNRYLVDKYSPFKYISPKNCKLIDDFIKIRNFITHRSRHSMFAYKKVLEKYNLKKLLYPGYFLMAHDQKKNMRFRYYIDAMFKANHEMRKGLKITYAVLSL